MTKIKQRPRARRKHPNRRPRAEPRSGGRSDREFIESAVRTGYEVSEAWLRQGTRFARRLSRLAPPVLPANSAIYRRWMELYMELINVWFDLLGRYNDLPIDSEGAGDDSRYEEDSDYEDYEYDDRFDDGFDADFDDDWDDQSSSVNVVFEVQSGHRTRMDLRFHDGSATNHVAIPSLTSVGGGGPPLSVGCSAPDEDTLLVEIRSDDASPTGQYVGVVLDSADGQPVGTLNVTLS